MRKPTVLFAACGAAMLVGAASPRATGDYTIREYLLPHQNPAAFAHDPAAAADGMVYFADQQGHYIGQLNPETGAVKEFPTTTPRSGPHGIVVSPDGMVWFTGNAAGFIGRLDPKSGTMTEFKTKTAAG